MGKNNIEHYKNLSIEPLYYINKEGVITRSTLQKQHLQVNIKEFFGIKHLIDGNLL